MIVKKAVLILLIPVVMLFLISPVSAVTEEEKSFLAMYFRDEELVVLSATRSLKSIARIAENVEVVTAEDIELMNAHTLADVLNTINGVQVFFAGSTPGNLAMSIIQGSDIRHVVIFMDGIPLSSLSSNVADAGIIPVQFFEKVEVIKGPASSVWGSSLGGVVNIITKAPDSQRVKGLVSASAGGRSTGDFRAEVSGGKDRFGAYLYAGRLQSNGLRPNNDVSQNDLYAKLSFSPAQHTRVLLTAMYGRTSLGAYEDREFDIFGRARNERFNASLSLSSAVNKDTDLDLSLWTLRLDEKATDHLISDGSELIRGTADSRKFGISAKVTWRRGIHTIVSGADYDDGTLRSNSIAKGRAGVTKWAFFANDSIDLGQFSITPGIRYDHSDIHGGFISPSLGATYELTKTTLLRAFVARGFSYPSLSTTYGDNVYVVSNPDLKAEQVWSYQAGIETAALKYLWLKLSVFRHDIKDGIVPDIIAVDPETGIWTSKVFNKERIRRQGVEVGLKSRPVFNTIFYASATFQEIEDRKTGEEIRDVPEYTYNAGLKYDDGKSLRGVIQGNYIWFNAPGYHLAKYSAFLVNANVIRTVYKKDDRKLDLFLTAHNLFNGHQYWDYWYKNARRWVEAGVRYTF